MRQLTLLESVYSPYATVTAGLIYMLTPKRLLFIPLILLYFVLSMWHQWAGTGFILLIAILLLPFGLYQMEINKRYTYRVFVMIPLHSGLRRRIEKMMGIEVEGAFYEMHWNKQFKTEGVPLRELVHIIREDCVAIEKDFSKRHTNATVVTTLCTASIADVGLKAINKRFTLVKTIKDFAPIGSRILRPHAKWETRVWKYNQ